MIEKYQFGSIDIDGKTYNFDVEVWWTGEVLKWWRNQGHYVGIEDVKRAIEKEPEIIVIGTGKFGVLKVGKETKNFIKEKGIELIIDITDKAIKAFNENKHKKVIGLFHLTC